MALNLIKKDKSHSVVSIKLDEQEFHNIFKEYYAALCSFAFQYMEDADMSADIVQDVFAKLWQIRDDFFYLHQVKAFLYTAVRNHALNELEHSKVAHEYEQKIIAKKADAFFRDAIVEEETFRILSEAIEKLPTQMRAIMQLWLIKSFVHSLPIIIIAFCYLSKSTFFSIFSKKSLYRFTMFSFWLVLSLKID